MFGGRQSDHRRIGTQVPIREVLKRIHDAFGHACRSTGVEDVQLVTARFDALRRRHGRLEFLVADSTLDVVSPVCGAPIIHLDKQSHPV